MAENKATSPSKEVLAAYLRQGAHELGAALYPSGTVAQHPEYGMPFTRTPGEVADGLRAQEPPAEHNVQPTPQPTALDAYVQHGHEPETREAPQPQREPERDLDRA